MNIPTNKLLLKFLNEMIIFLGIFLQLVTSPEGNQLYEHVTPAQQKNASIVNSLFQLHQAVTKVTIIMKLRKKKEIPSQCFNNLLID